MQMPQGVFSCSASDVGAAVVVEVDPVTDQATDMLQ